MDDGAKPRDLEDRTFLFAESVRGFCETIAENNRQYGRCSAIGACVGGGRGELD